MKAVYLVIFLLVFFHLDSHAQIYGDEILTFDFENGIPADWQNVSESGIGLWEYRGPSTNPDINTPSRGSCGESTTPISSNSLSNGYMVFDSNYWDDEIGPCGNLGSGLDPGPHNADLITGAIDLSNESNVVLTFQQQYKNFQTLTEVLVSVDGGITYTSIITNNTQQSFYSGEVVYASANISEIAANQSDVRVKFHFEGLYYYWMIDDITFYEPNEDDLLLAEARYTAFDFTQGETGLGKMEYSVYPNVMIEPFQFHADVLNIGDNAQTDVQLTADIYDSESNLVGSSSALEVGIFPGDQVIMATPIYVPPAEVGDYTIDFNLSQSETDENLENNSLTRSYSISEHTWARDQGAKDAEYTHTENYLDVPFEHGNYFESITQGEFKITSLTVAFSNTTDIGALAYAKIYDFSRENVLAESEPYTVNTWDLNAFGESKFVTLQLTEPLILHDSLYLAVIGSLEEEGRVRLSTSGNGPAQTSILIYPNQNGVFYTLATPMVRMNLFPISANPGCSDPLAINYNSEADTEDGSCRIAGCTDPLASGYNPNANFDDGSCASVGCPDPEADNYNPNAETSDLSVCIYSGCTDELANNFDTQANLDDGSCTYSQAAFSLNEVFGCAPFTLEFSNQTELANEGECLVNFGDGTEVNNCSSEILEHTFIEPGEYVINYSYNIAGETSSASETVLVLAALQSPIITYNPDNDEVSCSNCNAEDTYNWYLNGDLLLEDAPFNVINPSNGNYVLEVNNGSNCTAESAVLSVTSIPELKPINSLYPNPVTSELNVEVSVPVSHWEIYDLTGRVVKSGESSSNNLLQINMSNFSSGQYVIQLNTRIGISRAKFAKK